MGDWTAAAKSLAVRYFTGENLQLILEAKPIDLNAGSPPQTKTLYASTGPPRHTGAAKPCLPGFRPGSLRQRTWSGSWGQLVRDNVFEFNAFGTPSVQSGGFTLDNADGHFDDWVLDYNWQDAVCTVYIGEPTGAFSAYEKLWSFRTRTEPTFSPRGDIVFSDVKLPLANFNEPLTTTNISGQQRLRPRLWGECNHIKPELVDSATYKYEVDATNGVTSTWTVFEGGVDIGAHVTWVSPGVSSGQFTVDGSPAYEITGTFVESSNRKQVAQVVSDIATHMGVTATQVGSGLTSDAGIYVSSDHTFTFGEALNALVAPRGLWWVDPDGTAISFRSMGAPDNTLLYASVDLALTDVKAIRRVDFFPHVRHNPVVTTKYWDPPATAITSDLVEIARFREGGIVTYHGSIEANYPEEVTAKTPQVVFSDSLLGYANDGDLTTLIAMYDNTVRDRSGRGVYEVEPNPFDAFSAFIGDLISVDVSGAAMEPVLRMWVLGVELDFASRRVLWEALG